MDITQTVTVAAIAGAGLFFAGGYLTRSLRRGSAAALPERDAVEHEALGRERDQRVGELERARSGLQAAEAARDRLQAEREALAAQQASAASESKREQARLQAALAQQEQAAASRAEEAAQARAELQRKLGEAARVQAELQLRADETAQARVELQRKVEEAAQAGAELQRLSSEASRSRGEREQQTQELAQAQRRAAQALAEVQRSDARRQALERELEQQREALQQAMTGADRAAAEGKERLAQLQEQLAAAEARAALRGGAGDSERLEQLRAEHAELARQCEQLKASSVPAEEVEQLRGKQRHMLVQARMMQQQLGEMEEHARENVGLKRQLALAQAELATAAQLAQRLRRSEARLLAAGLAVDEAVAPSARPVMASAIAAAPRANALEQQLARLVAPGAAHAVVLADERGLQLAAAGTETYHEALAVLSANIAELGQTASTLLPFDAGRSLQLVDRNGLSIGTRMFEAAGQGFLVAALGASLAQRPELEEVVSAVTEIVER
ncbi:MAG: hypothetical protein IPG96_11955 [Proteobacteria bacterium]|nr:hypothetical protein [Pseudomonadota bacterium]